ncbi:ankyrin, partial [Lentithecium fluviatile CBS 122367]
LLLNRNADVNLVGGSGLRALNIAAWNGNEEAVRLLIEHGAAIDPDEEYWYGSAVGAASRRGHAEIIMKALIEKGADVNKRGGEFGCPLQGAAWYGDADNVKMLLDHGA